MLDVNFLYARYGWPCPIKKAIRLKKKGKPRNVFVKFKFGFKAVLSQRLLLAIEKVRIRNSNDDKSTPLGVNRAIGAAIIEFAVPS